MLKSNKKNLVLNSAVVLNEHVEAQGKGRKFVSRFIEAGVAHYQEFGDILITKETLDKFINTMIGCPVIINHKDITEKNADDERVGVVSNVWYSEGDGWYYCEGIIWDKQAIDLVKNHNWNVSCTYDFESDFIEKTHNGKKIDMEFTNGKFLHLALVNNPRYERANIVMNSKDTVYNWISKEDIAEWITTEDGVQIPIKKGLSKKEGIKEFAKLSANKRKEKNAKKDEAYRILAEASGKDIKYLKQNLKKSEKLQKEIEKLKTSDTLNTKASFDNLKYYSLKDIEEIDGQEKLLSQAFGDIMTGNFTTEKTEQENRDVEINKYYTELENKYNKIIADYEKDNDLTKAETKLAKLYGFDEIEEINDTGLLEEFYQDIDKKTTKIDKSEELKYKEAIKAYKKTDKKEENGNIVDVKVGEENRKSQQAKPDFDKILKEKQDNKAQNGKDIFMAVLNELENFVKSIVENACDKKEKIEEKEAIVENEDKRKLIDEVGGILKGKVDEEVWRTVIGKLEKIAYNPSETDKADNKCKNEDDEEEEKFEEEKEIAENKKAKNEKVEEEVEKKEKVENSMDKAREIAMGGNEYKNSSYISQKERLELGNNY